MSSNRRTRKLQNTREESNILFYGLLCILFYPPLFRGLFFSKELLFTHIATAALFMAVVYFKPGFRPVKILSNPMDYAALALLGIYIISNFNAAVPRDAVKETLKLANYLMIYYLVSNYAFREINLRRILEAFYSSGLLVALIGIFSVLGLNGGEGILADRISSTLQYPNTLAAYLLSIFVIGLYLYPRYKNKYMTYFVCAGNFLLFLTLLWTKSRGGFLFLPIPILLFILGIRENRKATVMHLIQSVILAIAMYAFASNTAAAGIKFLLITAGIIISLILHMVINKVSSQSESFSIKKWQYGVLIGVILVACVGIIGATPVGEKISESFSRITTTSLQERNVQERLVFYKDAISVFKGSPILGYGGGGWAGVYQKFQTYAYQSREVHNNYLQVLIETGIIGFLAYVSLWVSFLWMIIKNQKSNPAGYKDVNWLVFSVAIAIGLTSMVDFNMTFGAIAILLWSMFGIARGIANTYGERAGQETFNITTDGSVCRIISLGLSAVILVFSFSLFIGALQGEDGLYYYNNDKYDMAEEKLSSAVTFDPLNVSYTMALAEVWGEKGLAERNNKGKEAEKQINESTKTAIQYAERAVQLEPNNPETHINKGNAHLKGEQVPEAVAEYEKAISLVPTNQKYYNRLADVCLRAGKYYAYIGQGEKAREYLRKALDVPKLIEAKAKEIPFSEKMPWIKEQYNLTADNNELTKTLQEARDALSGL